MQIFPHANKAKQSKSDSKISEGVASFEYLYISNVNRTTTKIVSEQTSFNFKAHLSSAANVLYKERENTVSFTSSVSFVEIGKLRVSDVYFDMI